MKKVKRGTIQVIKRGRKKYKDPYLQLCVDSVRYDTDIICSKIKIKQNSSAEKYKYRARIMSLSAKCVGVGWTYPKDGIQSPLITLK